MNIRNISNKWLSIRIWEYWEYFGNIWESGGGHLLHPAPAIACELIVSAAFTCGSHVMSWHNVGSHLLHPWFPDGASQEEWSISGNGCLSGLGSPSPPGTSTAPPDLFDMLGQTMSNLRRILSALMVGPGDDIEPEILRAYCNLTTPGLRHLFWSRRIDVEGSSLIHAIHVRVWDGAS